MTARKAQIAFVSAILMLLLSGVAALLAFANLRRGERLVGHTHSVKDSIAEVESLGARISRARLAYVLSGDERFLSEYEANIGLFPPAIQRLKQRTEDNSVQRANCARLQQLSDERLRLWQSALELRKKGQAAGALHNGYIAQSLNFGSQIAEVTRAMKDHEDQLLGERRQAADSLFRLTLAIIVGAFIAALALFFLHYKLLRSELELRQRAEQAAREAEQSTRDGQEALRHLSVRLLQLQDEERRRFSRELHDSVGQYLAGLKMTLGRLQAPSPPQANLLTECLRMTDQCISETRTMSYLLHPPLLDESGIASAAEWYVNGFAQRSGVNVKLDLPKERLRLPPAVELTLFRILQESLTNIHRNSKSPSAEVSLVVAPHQAVLSVKDAGNGMPRHFLARFNRDGTGAGVGLTGISERVRELGGHLQIDSSMNGTTVAAIIPLTAEQQVVKPHSDAKPQGSAA